MPVQKFEIAAPTSLDELLQGNPKVASATKWVQENLADILKDEGFVFDKLGSSGYPLVIRFMRANATDNDALAIVSVLSKTLGKFTTGVENKMTPVVRITQRFKAGIVFGYCVVTLWVASKKLTVTVTA